MNRDLINRIVGSGAFKKPPEPPRSSLRFGECTADAADGWAEVLLDGDQDAETIRTATDCVNGDRVIVALIGETRVVLTWIDPQP